jgi:hypothetical protein
LLDYFWPKPDEAYSVGKEPKKSENNEPRKSNLKQLLSARNSTPILEKRSYVSDYSTGQQSSNSAAKMRLSCAYNDILTKLK